MNSTVSKHIFHVPFVWLIFLVLFSASTFADQRGRNQPHVMEVFTSARHPIVESYAIGSGSNSQEPEISVYEIDGIHSVERDISLNLPAEPQQSKQIALQRIRNLDEQTRTRMQSAAHGLAKVIQYGVDRIPAIVIDGKAVMYGITDVHVALAHYRAWRTGDKP